MNSALKIYLAIKREIEKEGNVGALELTV